MGRDPDLRRPGGKLVPGGEAVLPLVESAETVEMAQVVEGERGLELLLGEEAQGHQGLALLAAVRDRYQAALESADVDPALLEEKLAQGLEAEEYLGAAGLAVSKIYPRNPALRLDMQLPRYSYPERLDEDRRERRGGKITRAEVAKRLGHRGRC